MKTIRVVLFLLILVAPVREIEAGRQSIRIGTGGITGVYYPTGGAICRLLNRSRKDHGIRCMVESTGGSIYNINAVQTGRLDFGIVQSDLQYQAYHGTSHFAKKGQMRNLRSVFSVHSEPFTVVARADSGIKKFRDLAGKRVNIGNPGSDQRQTMEAVMKALGWDKSIFALASELKLNEQSQALCNNRIDAIIFTVGHPSGLIKEVTSSCNAVLVQVTGPEINRLVEETTYYRHAIIPGGLYRETDRDIPTFGISATLVTTADVSDYVVYHLVKAIFENFDQFRKLHPAFKNLKRREMIKEGLSAPLHPGAEKYYKEKGMK